VLDGYIISGNQTSAWLPVAATSSKTQLSRMIRSKPLMESRKW
jgi:hypothetical protein